MKLKKATAIFLLMAVLLPLCFAAPRVQAAETPAAQTDLHGTIEEQIRAYADSIDQKDADGSAARILAMHGIMMGGRTLYADEDHALTATLMNSELVQMCLTEACTNMVGLIQVVNTDVMYGIGGCSWYSDHYSYSMYAYEDPEEESRKTTVGRDRDAQANTSYDRTLIWLAGGTLVEVVIRRVAVLEEYGIYDVDICVRDRFDFNTETVQDVPSTLLALFGAAAFREYDWEASASFQLKVPYSCTHQPRDYHWVYDPDNHMLISDDGNGFLNNDTTAIESIDVETGKVSYSYQLEDAVRLKHDRPWVLEYTITGSANIMFTATSLSLSAYPDLYHRAGTGAYLREYRLDTLDDDWDGEEELTYSKHYYGHNLSTSSKNTYTYRYENVIADDGTNMVYLTVYDHNNQLYLVDFQPMDNHYILTSGKSVLHDTKNHWANGKDLMIQFVGKGALTLNNCQFELFVWENGANGGEKDLFESETVKPGCTTPGGTRRTCADCGYSYTEETTPATGHDWGAYKSNKDATCQKDGTKTAACKTCGEKKTVPDEGSQADHEWTAATCLYPQTCLTCGETQGEIIDHNWVDATCTEPKKCTMCGLTEGKALGHKWSGSTCEHANTCNVCGTVSGEPKAHTWVEATCTSAKRCSFCGTVDGEPLGHDFVGGSCTAGPVCSRCGGKDAAFGHQWTAADCYSARTCSVCGFADGEAMGHSWIGPTCTEAKYCGVCAMVEGELLGHIFADATCDAPRTCTGCELTEGEPLGHDWIDADCENPKHCARCAVTEGEPLGHAWMGASCTTPKACEVCGKTEGTVLEHGDGDGDLTCDQCGLDLSIPTEPTAPPTTIAPTQTPTTAPSVTKPDDGEEEAGNGLIWIICGIALAAIGAVSAGLILRKKKN